MWRNAFLLSLIFCFLINTGCKETPEKTSPDRLHAIGNIDLYTFSSDDRYLLSSAQPFPLSADTSLEDALTSLGNYLSESYFAIENTDSGSKILFEVVEIYEIPKVPNNLRVAVINMIDRGRHGMNYFFQGSTGGQTTFCILGATFMQPQLATPLLDGLIILYNEEALPELDHINLSGILTPRLFKYVANRAIFSTRIEAI